MAANKYDFLNFFERDFVFSTHMTKVSDKNSYLDPMYV